MSQEIDDMVKAIKQKTEELGAGMTITLAPLTSDAEKLALEIGRYRSHVGQITDADAAAREITKQRGEVMNQLRQLDDNINRITGIITFFWASLPALHAQWLLASGRGLIYQVSEKTRRSIPQRLVLQGAEIPPAPSTRQENA